MFETDHLIFIQMQKTGCTHIASVLSKLFDGKTVGKHNAATATQLRSGKIFVSSIRNPWDWYISLWSYGVQGNGALVRRLAKRDPIQMLADIRKRPQKAYRIPLRALTKDIDMWRQAYDCSNNVESFRRWLKLIHRPNNRQYLGEGYDDSMVAGMIGYMTHRYLRLCCQNVKKLDEPGYIPDFNALKKFDRDNCYIDYFIRQESLETDLCEVVEKIRRLTREERELIFGSEKLNRSNRSFSIADYYDEETTELVRSRDGLLIEKFGYSDPQQS